MLHWKSKPLKTQLIILNIVILVMLLLILSMVLLMDNRIMDRNARMYLHEQIQLSQSRLDEYYEYMNALTMAIAYDPVVQKRLIAETPADRYTYYDDVIQTIASVTQLSNDIMNVHLMDRDLETINASFVYLPEDIRAQLSGSTRKTGTFSPWFEYPARESGARDLRRVFVSNHITCIEDGKYFGERVGLVSIALDLSKVRRSLGLDVQRSLTSYIVDAYGVIIAAKDVTLTGKSFPYPEIMQSLPDTVHQSKIDQEITYYVHSVNAATGYRIVMMERRSEIITGFQGYGKLSLIIFGVVVLIVAFITYLVTRSMVQPVEEATRHMAAITDYESAQLNLEGSQEIAILSREFNHMIQRMETLNAEIVDVSTQLLQSQLVEKQSEMNMLMMQINPHFLYNTLESIKGMSMAGAKEAVQQATTAMADIFRYTIRGKNFVPLRQELKILKQYMTIQTLRYRDRFDVIYAIDETALDCIVPKMILQPLCENSIHHGIELLSHRGQIVITITHRDDTLHIQVQDNGEGIPPHQLTAIQAKLALSNRDTVVDDNASIGIYNVNSRIRLHYGEPYGLQIDTTDNGDTVVTITLPCCRED